MDVLTFEVNYVPCNVYNCTVDQDDSNSGSEKKKKRRSRWGNSETENVVSGLPVVVPQGLTKEQEEQYLRKFIHLMLCFQQTVCENS